MKTKEEILKPSVFKEEANYHDVVYEDDALRAMEEYAKEVGKDFASWINSNWYYQHEATKLWSISESDEAPITSDQLFNLYLKSEHYKKNNQ